MTAQPVTAQLQRLLLALLISFGMLGAQAADAPEEEDPRLAPGQGALLRSDYTQADLSNLRSAGYSGEFRSVEAGVGGYVRELLAARG